MSELPGTVDDTTGDPEGDPEHLQDIGRKVGRGLSWSLAGNIAFRAGSFIMSLILARILMPGDFGIFAVAFSATQLVMVLKDIGVMAAVMQWRGKLEEIAPTATTITFISALTLYAGFYLIAPWYAHSAGTDAATPVVRLLTSIILVEAVTAVRSATLLRTFQQSKASIAILIGFAANMPVAIILAVEGFGAYSFAWGQVARAVVTGIVTLWFTHMPFRLGWKPAIARQLLKFGIPSAAGIALETALLYIGNVIVGGIMGPVWTGFYLLAFNVSSWVPGLIGTAIRTVSIAGFSRLAERDTESLTRGVQRSVPILIGAILPVAAVMGVLAHPLIGLLYGEKWGQSAGVLRFLAVLMVARMLTALALDILNSQGATRATVWMNLGYGAAMVPTVIVLTHMYGIRGAAAGQALTALLVALPLAMWAVQRAGVRLAPILPHLVRPLIGTLIMCAVMMVLAYVLDDAHFLVQLVVAGGAGFLVYAAVVLPQFKRLMKVAA
ncbi:oligosaccharide flippase family protein [Streptosporangiaceae bacterium NEAU-GS5]|nr:oligosaccharide flippase family protein [Streptosporangiaceae bacterium NEAU-GS5]